MKKVLLVVLIAIGIISLFISVPSWVTSFFSTNNHQAEITNNIKLIEIDVEGTNATIIPKNQDEVTAELKGKGKVEVVKKGNSIEVQYRRKWFEWFSFFDKTKLTISIPEDYDRDLDVEVGSGNINFVNSEDLHLDNVEVEIGSGNVQIETLNVNSGDFKVSSGNMDIDQFTGKLEANVSSGNLVIHMDELTDNVEADVSSGHLKLDLPDDSNFTLDARVSSGHIANKFQLENEQSSKNELSGKHGTGKYHIDLNVSSGVVELN
ncbi:DUF4097 family beta strand repeat-containing protein [Ureibacillus composti]|nr:DUF4097 family beta strand repeat-containing protein [Ureibacillus composti]